MKKLLKDITLEAGEGIVFEIIRGDDGRIIIRANQKSDEEVCLNRYDQPMIPEGFDYIQGEWDSGFEIQSKKSGLSYIWIPVGALHADGVLGKILNSKFGVRGDFKEELSYGLRQQFESVQKYGGFYISKGHIQENHKYNNGSFSSNVERAILTNIDFLDALNKAQSMEIGEGLKSHLLFGAEYDSAMKFVELYGVKLNEDITPLQEWTQEGKNRRALRNSKEFSEEREFVYTDEYSEDIGFRIALWLQ